MFLGQSYCFQQASSFSVVSFQPTHLKALFRLICFGWVFCHQILQRHCSGIGHITIATEAAIFLLALVIVEGLQNIIIFKPAGLSDHVSSIFFWSVDAGNKVELLQIFSQTTDRTGILRFCKYDHSFQLIPVFLLQFCNGTAHGIE